MNRSQLLERLLKTRGGWDLSDLREVTVSCETLLEALEATGLLSADAQLPDLRVCPSCGRRAEWPDGFANSSAPGTHYVCKLCSVDAWVQMLPSNRAFSLSNPKPGDVDILDISLHLSGINRYHGGAPLTVAEHAVRCSLRAPKGLEFEALHHDSHEAYTGDVVGPMKRLMGPEYRAIEERVDRVVRWALKLHWPPSPEVHEVDLRMLETERLQLFGAAPRPWCVKAEPYADETIDCWAPKEARERFLDRHEELGGKPC